MVENIDSDSPEEMVDKCHQLKGIFSTVDDREKLSYLKVTLLIKSVMKVYFILKSSTSKEHSTSEDGECRWIIFGHQGGSRRQATDRVSKSRLCKQAHRSISSSHNKGPWLHLCIRDDLLWFIHAVLLKSFWSDSLMLPANIRQCWTLQICVFL